MAGQETFLVNAWYRGARWLWILRPLELVYRGLTALRHSFYRTGIFSSYRAAKPVVIVGNITVGGTGKTPVVIALVEALEAQGIRAGVVSRGYGGSAESYPHIVASDSQASQCGDEPLLIHKRTNAPCVVDPRRSRAVKTLIERFDPDLVLCDDGLQHYALQRDMEIALLDAQRGIGNGFCLPAGPLREPQSRLERVEWVLHRGGDNPGSSVCYDTAGLVNLASGEQLPLQPLALKADKIHALAGIGQPQQFFNTLAKAGFEAEMHIFADHHEYTESDLSCLNDKPILMTEKDAVKCTGIAGDNAWYLKLNARLPDAVIDAVAALAKP